MTRDENLATGFVRVTKRRTSIVGVAAACLLLVGPFAGEPAAQPPGPEQTLRHPEPLEAQLKATDLSALAREVQLRGDPRRGALVFFTSPAACVQCHAGGEDASPLGPDLAKPEGKPTPEYLIESIVFPSAKIRKGYETVSILTDEGQVLSGMVAREDEDEIVLRDASDLLRDVRVSRDSIESIRRTELSMMPDGLIPVIGDLRSFYDLAAYVIEVAQGGPQRAAELKPSEEELRVADDIADLDHAGILKKLGRRDFDAGEAIYHGYCNSCHGSDGNTPSLATARAFGKQKLKFGSDPYAMFMTLSRGNGMMAPMTQLTPKERYQVVHYIREAFIKPGGLDEIKVDADYLAGLPEGSDPGDRVLSVDRDFGPALASQLERRINSALTLRLGELTLSYDLHSLNVAGVWSGGFLDLDNTQHIRGRGEGTADPASPLIDLLSFRRWGHDGTLDYPTEHLPPRGPMPREWLDYRGHYLHGDRAVLSYAIDGREVLESPELIARGDDELPLLSQTLRIGPGRRLVLAAGRLEGMRPESDKTSGRFDVSRAPFIAVPDDDSSDPTHAYFAFGITGEAEGVFGRVDEQNRLVVEIPESDDERLIRLVYGIGSKEADSPKSFVERFGREQLLPDDPGKLIDGGPLRWEPVLSTLGYPGLEQGAYCLDTIMVPDSTPWNTWFRTSAIDFFPDGRMVVTTYGGDVWIVSGVDEDLLDVRWKRFAGGLYEPMGVKVVDGRIYVAGKDRITCLHDLNGNGEADFYESFAADPDVSVNFHAFNFDLQVDSQGNFYYAKSGHGADFDLPGAIYKVSPDGKYHEVYSTGFRTPNGMGILPDGRVTASDNQGQWTPASKINLLQPGGFYGWVPTYDGKGRWSPGGGSIDPAKVVPPESFDPPLVWMPQVLDNSSGGQVWVDDPRFGPLSGRFFHTSFGRGWMNYLMIQEVGEAAQAAIIKLPFDFRSGIMRAAVNPADGQVYAVGLDGWNGGGRAGLLDHGIQRLRHTGKPHAMVSGCRVEAEGLRLEFNFAPDRETAADPEAYRVQCWNYLWQAAYGSEMYSPSTGEVGVDRLEASKVEISDDGRSVLLHLPDLQPVDQLHLVLKVKDEQGRDFEEEIYWTIHRIPGR